MPTGFDHIVIAVNDLDQTIADYTSAGFTVTPGGEHKGGQSHNALVTLQDGAYFELIAFKGEGRSDSHWPELLRKGEGLVDYALRTNDLSQEVADLRAAGLDAGEPLDGGRFRPDGQRIDWQTLRFGTERGPSVLPFYCHDLTERTLRVPNGNAAVHANGATGVAGVTVVTGDLDAASEKLRPLSGDDGTDVRPEDADGGRARRFAIGAGWIELVEPAEGTGARSYLETRGELPYEVTLTAPDAGGAVLDTGLTHGARLRVVSEAAVIA